MKLLIFIVCLLAYINAERSIKCYDGAFREGRVSASNVVTCTGENPVCAKDYTVQHGIATGIKKCLNESTYDVGKCSTDREVREFREESETPLDYAENMRFCTCNTTDFCNGFGQAQIPVLLGTLASVLYLIY